MCVLKSSSRTPERFLTAAESWRQSGRWYARNGHRAAGNTASAVNHFKTKTVTYLVLMRLVNLNDDIFLGLGRDLPPRIDLRPVENAEPVKTVFSRQQLVLSKRLFPFDPNRLIDQRLFCGPRSQCNDRIHRHLWPFTDEISHLQAMRIS